METSLRDAASKSPRTIAVEKGFELVETSGGTYCYEHPTSKIGVLIDVNLDNLAKQATYDWSIHKPETMEVIEAKWGEANGISFLSTLIQIDLGSHPAHPAYTPTDSLVEEEINKGECQSCKGIRELDSNGFCWFC
jgi:hypothetical protein